METIKGRDTLILSRLDRLEEPPRFSALRDHVLNLLPRVDLPELLLEIHAPTGFANECTHISEGEARVTELPVCICAVLLAEACNIGLEPVVRSDHRPDASATELGPTKLYPRRDADAGQCLPG